MRALVQRVSEASVTVAGERIAAIGPGLLVLLGITHDDDAEVADRVAAKLRGLRLFPGPDGRMDQPLGARGVLVVSQFTLYGDTRKGLRPSYVAAAGAAQSEPLYERIADALGAQRGRFGAEMAVALINDGPVTVLVELDRDAPGQRPRAR